MSLSSLLLPEIILVVAACALFLKGLIPGKLGARFAAGLAVLALLAASGVAINQWLDHAATQSDAYANLHIGGMASWLRVLCLVMGLPMVLLSWPGDRAGTGNLGANYGKDSGEYFGLILLAFAGLAMVCSANDLVLLFLAIELASIPTYILVSTSRPVAAAQEAGLKYFFLGALSAAIMLMGMAYLYGAAGTTNLHEIASTLGNGVAPGAAPALNAWYMLAAVMIILGLCFKLAAVPLHTYAADVYQGAGTAVTALLGFVPKAVGLIALIKFIFVFAGGYAGEWLLPDRLGKLLFILSILTMTVGNLLALTQLNIKRMFAYSSVAHSGYLLAGLAMMTITRGQTPDSALSAVLFYLAVYGVMSTVAFGVLAVLPSRQVIVVDGREIVPAASSAETFDDVAGVGRRYPLIGVVMAVACLGLAGIPFTAGFWGKFFLISTALADGGRWTLFLAFVLIANSALGAAYYLRVIAAMFHRAAPDEDNCPPAPVPMQIALGLGAAAILLFGTLLQATGMLSNWSHAAAGDVDTISLPTESQVAR